jgi:hypothetical protein
MTAAPSLFATLIADKKKDLYENGKVVQRELTFEVIKARHDGETKLICFRLGDDPKFSTQARAGHSLPDNMVRVLQFVADYNVGNHAEPLRLTNKGRGPQYIGSNMQPPWQSLPSRLR